MEIEADNKKTPSNDKLDKCKPQLAGISLVFNKEDNILQEVKTRNDTSDQDAKVWDLDKISKMTHGNKENALHKLTTIKSNKLLLKTDNTKPTVPRTIVIKDSKDALDKTKIIVPSLRRHKTDETMYMKIKNTFFKHNKLEPKAVEKVTDIGSVFGKDKIPFNQSNKINLHTYHNSEDSPEKENSLIKINTSKPKLPTVDASHQVKDTLSNPNSFLKNDSLEPKPLNAKDTRSTSVLDEDSQIACHDFDTPETQLQDISQKTKEPLTYSKINEGVTKSVTLQPTKSPAETPNINNILTADTKRSTERVTQKISGNISTNDKKDSELPTKLPKKSEENVTHKINNSVSSAGIIKPEIPVQEPTKHEDKISQEANGSILKSDKVELKSSSSAKLTKPEYKLPQKRSDHITVTEIQDEKSSNVKEPINAKNTLSLEKSASTAINEKIELKTQSKEGTTKSEGKLSPKKSKVTFCNPGGSGIPQKETSQKSEELLSLENSYSTTTTNNSQQEVSPENSENILSKHNNSREDSTSSSITIGLLMTEISLKPNKVYESTDSVKANKSDANVNNPFLVNIPKTENNVNDTSSSSQPAPSELSTITKEIFFRKEADISLQDVEINMKPIKTNISKQRLDMFSSSTISEPHTSVTLQEKDKAITHNLSDTSTNRYNQKIKKFWKLFTTKYPT